LKKHARTIAFLLLAAVTAYSFYRFAQDDWRPAVEAWQGRWHMVALAFAVNYLGIALDAIGWFLVSGSLGIKVRPRLGVGIYLTVYATQLVPMQLGRLIRPDAVVRTGSGTLGRSVKAEAILFYLDLGALLCLLGAVTLYIGLPFIPYLGIDSVALGMIVSGLAFVLACIALLAVANFATRFVVETRLALPLRYWFEPRTVAVLLLRSGDWVCTGTILWLLLADLPGDLSYARSIFFSLASTLVGSGSGLPGGIGATEGILGWFLAMVQLPAAHLVIAVGLYRFITFWMQVPLGWAALVWVNRRVAERG